MRAFPRFSGSDQPIRREKITVAKYRHDRINEEMYRVAAEILRTVKDPRLNQAFVSVTGAEVSPDLKYAKIYYSHLQGDPKEIRRGLAAASGYIRGQLAKTLNLRVTPELTFCEDKSIAYGAHIEKVISGFTYKTAPDEQDSSQSGDRGGQP